MIDGADECVEIQIATRAHLVGEGIDFRYPFAVCIIRQDGKHFDVVSATVADVASLVETLTPPKLGLSVAPYEDHDALLAAIRGRDCDSDCTLH